MGTDIIRRRTLPFTASSASVTGSGDISDASFRGEPESEPVPFELAQRGQHRMAGPEPPSQPSAI
jgi:hypothetical protein